MFKKKQLNVMNKNLIKDQNLPNTLKIGSNSKIFNINIYNENHKISQLSNQNQLSLNQLSLNQLSLNQSNQFINHSKQSLNQSKTKIINSNILNKQIKMNRNSAIKKYQNGAKSKKFVYKNKKYEQMTQLNDNQLITQNQSVNYLQLDFSINEKEEIQRNIRLEDNKKNSSKNLLELKIYEDHCNQKAEMDKQQVEIQRIGSQVKSEIRLLRIIQNDSILESQNSNNDNILMEGFQNKQIKKKIQYKSMSMQPSFQSISNYKKKSLNKQPVSEPQEQLDEMFLTSQNIIDQKKQYEKIKKQNTQELFRNLRREIAANQQIERIKNNKKDLYEGLRIKLTSKLKEIQKDYRQNQSGDEKQNIQLLIQGCNIERHRRSTTYFRQKNNFHNPSKETVMKAFLQVQKDITKISSNRKIRPNTYRPDRKYAQSQKPMDQKSSKMYLNLGTPQNFRGKIAKNMSSIFCLSKKQISQEHKCSHNKISISPTFKEMIFQDKQINQKNNEQKSNLQNKFNNFLQICSLEQDQSRDLINKMNIFQYYVKKIDMNFQKITEKISNYIQKI